MDTKGAIARRKRSSRKRCVYSMSQHHNRAQRSPCGRLHLASSLRSCQLRRQAAPSWEVHDRSARTQEVAYIGTHSAPQDPGANGDARDTQGPAHKHKQASTCNRSCCSSRAFAPCPLLLLAASMRLLRRRRQRQLATAAELQQLVSRYPVTAAQRS